MLLNRGVGEDSWESFGQQGDQTSQYERKSTLNIHSKGWCWSLSSNTLATWCKELTHWKRPWCWERLKAGGEGDNRGWDGWMASLTQWTRVWESSGSWWWTGKPGVLQSRGSQRVERDWVTELNWINNHVLEERMSVMEIDPNSDSLLDINEEQMNRRDSFEFNDRQLMEERDERKFISETTLWFVLCSITF